MTSAQAAAGTDVVAEPPSRPLGGRAGGAHPHRPRGGHGGPSRRGEATVELWVGALLVALVAALGAYLAWRPASSRPDAWILGFVRNSHSPWFTEITRLRYPWVVVLGAAVVAVAVAMARRDLVRAAACLVGPPLALGLCEVVAKPLVGRRLGGAYSFPSGSVAGAAALGTVVVVAVRGRWRLAAAATGALYAVWMAVSVIALQWHLPTDSLAGLAFGCGVVLVVAGAALAVGEWMGIPPGTGPCSRLRSGAGARPGPPRDRARRPPPAPAGDG